jgi:hypothetical protein
MSHRALQALAFPAALAAAALPAPALAQAPSEAPWQNGTNLQPASPLVTGPLTWSFMVDTYYGYAFNRPADHTVFPTTAAPRHNEFNLNHAFLGAEVTGLDNVLGKLVLQTGNYVDTLYGADPTLARGAYSGILNIHSVQQAYAGYRFPALGGLNFRMGIFPAYIGLESYNTQEDWNYTHSYLSDFTPYYLVGACLHGNARDDLGYQLWLVNGWQSVSKYGEGVGGGWQLSWSPSERLSATHNFLVGNFDKDPSRTRFYTDNNLQWLYAKPGLPWLQRLAIAAVAEYGFETAGTSPALPAVQMAGASLYHRAELNDQWALSARGSVFSDPQALQALTLPNNLSLPSSDPLLAREATLTLDYKPAAWVTYRLEYRHDWSSIPYIVGPGGLTPPAGQANWKPDLLTSGDRLTANATVRF